MSSSSRGRGDDDRGASIDPANALDADLREDQLERICSRCGDVYRESENIGRWQCRGHSPDAILDEHGRFSCCGLTRDLLVMRLPQHVVQTAPTTIFTPADHLNIGCTPVDHDVPVMPPTRPGEAIAMRAWAQDYLRLVRPDALVTSPPSMVTQVLGGDNPLTKLRGRELFWTVALAEPDFYTYVGNDVPWLPVSDRLDLMRRMHAGQKAPPNLVKLDPAALGLVVAVRRQASGPGQDAIEYAQRMWRLYTGNVETTSLF